MSRDWIIQSACHLAQRREADAKESVLSTPSCDSSADGLDSGLEVGSAESSIRGPQAWPGMSLILTLGESIGLWYVVSPRT